MIHVHVNAHKAKPVRRQHESDRKLVGESSSRSTGEDSSSRPESPPVDRRLSRRLSQATLDHATLIKSKVKESKRARFAARVYGILSHDATQMALYVLLIILFQLIGNELRHSSEYFITKYITDVLLEAPFTEGIDADTFMGVGEIVDFFDWGDKVLWPGLFKHTYPRDPFGEGDEAVRFTPTELAGYMDRFDWTAGVAFNQLRVAPMPDSVCKSSHYGRVRHMIDLIEEFGTPVAAADEEEETKASETEDRFKDADPIPTRNHYCLPDLAFSGDSGLGTDDTTPFGYNWTHPGQPRDIPFLYYTSEQQGANPDGQPSASVEIDFKPIDNSGYPTFVLPFFSDTFLAPESGPWDQVTDHRLFAHNASKTPAYFCVRMSWNGEHIQQLCDPNDEYGRTTGAAEAAVLTFWNEMKRAHYIDPQTRAITIRMPLRNNNVGVRFRLTMMFQVTSVGAIVPSYDIESRKDTADAKVMMFYMTLTLIMTIYFAVMEVNELCKEGIFGYFSNMWNLMDWTNFVLYGLFFMAFNDTRKALNSYECSQICEQVGFHDPWSVMAANTMMKQVIAIMTTIQWLKVLKFINMFVPKFSLATSVLSHGLSDLVLFSVVFMWSILSFSQLFYMQLGPFMQSYASQTLAAITLARSLFGDFDIDAIMNSSNSMINVIMYLAYLFFAVFILLSIFLTILGEHQGFVREEQQDPSYYGIWNDEWGVLGASKDLIKSQMAKMKERGQAGLEAARETVQETPCDAPASAGKAVRSAMLNVKKLENALHAFASPEEDAEAAAAAKLQAIMRGRKARADAQASRNADATTSSPFALARPKRPGQSAEVQQLELELARSERDKARLESELATRKAEDLQRQLADLQQQLAARKRPADIEVHGYHEVTAKPATPVEAKIGPARSPSKVCLVEPVLRARASEP